MTSAQKEMAPQTGANQYRERPKDNNLDVSSKDEKTTFIKRSLHNKENPYVQISKSMLRDRNIDPFCKGVLSFMLSLPDTWELHPKHIANELNIGRDKIYSVLKKLMQAGYCRRNDIRIKGKFICTEYEISEEPIFKKVLPFPEKPDTAKPDTTNPYISKDRSLHTEERKDKETSKDQHNIYYQAPVSEQSSDVSLSSSSLKKEKKIPKPSEEALRLTDLFCKNLKQINPKFSIPNKLDSWATCFDLMLGKDGHTTEEIIKILDYLLKESKIQGKDFYWCDNIRSPAKLKEKFSDVWQALKRSKEKKPKHSEIVGSLNDKPEERLAQGGVQVSEYLYNLMKSKGEDMRGYICEEVKK